MVQGLPERVCQNAYENVSLRAPAVMMPDWPQAKLTLEDSEGAFNDRELNLEYCNFTTKSVKVGKMDRIQSNFGLAQVEYGASAHARDR